MVITSLVFLLFVFITLLIYYLVPQRIQWIILLLSSIVFYISSSSWGIIFVLVTSLTVYGSTMWMSSLRRKQKVYFKNNKGTLSRENKKEMKAKVNKKRKHIMIATLVINFSILCVFKYSHFAIEQVNGIISFFGGNAFNNSFNLISVLGISFYTFQSMGYVVEVYWETVDAEPNYFKNLLFISFFPQIIQGPISDYSQLSTELFSKHSFDYCKFVHGAERIVWGYFKKVLVADCLSPYVMDVFSNYNKYSSITCIIGMFFYSIQIYADFSGYMDIMCGVCELFGIKLSENFERPYFSKSIAEYWRRWHITLGAWFKRYIYFPIGASKWNRKLGKFSGDRFGKFIGENLPASLALVVVWFVTGLWHGASWAYIVWGGVNGIFIIFSMWMEPVYAKTKAILHVKEHSVFWRIFQVFRTFILVTYIKVLPEVGSLSDGLGLWKSSLNNWSLPKSFNVLLPFVNDKLTFFAICFGIMLMVIASVLQRKRSLFSYLDKIPLLVKVVFFSFLILLIFLIGVASSGNGGFMYAQF